jgi:methionyl aminopeptidase
MRGDATIAPARDARTHRGASRVLKGGTAVSPRASLALRSSEDIAGIRAAGEIVAGALEAARAACAAGVTTAELDRVVHGWIRSAGAEPVFLGYRGSGDAGASVRPPFPATSCISVNEELVHGVPGGRVLQAGDVVSIDAGVRFDGWCADSAITVAVGEVDRGCTRMVETAEAMLAEAILAIRPGIRWSSIARMMESIAVDAGFTIAVDFVGHGIGRELHEPPQVPCSVYASFLEGGDFTLRPGMVLAIEPMIVCEPPVRNERGELRNPGVTLAADGWTVVLDSGARSCHVEHTVAVTRDGAQVLTSREPTVHPLQETGPRRARAAQLAC